MYQASKNDFENQNKFRKDNANKISIYLIYISLFFHINTLTNILNKVGTYVIIQQIL